LQNPDEILLVGRRDRGPAVRLGQLDVRLDGRGGAGRVLPARGFVERVLHETRDAHPSAAQRSRAHRARDRAVAGRALEREQLGGQHLAVGR
jgi:hypothetical protein